MQARVKVFGSDEEFLSVWILLKGLKAFTFVLLQNVPKPIPHSSSLPYILLHALWDMDQKHSYDATSPLL